MWNGTSEMKKRREKNKIVLYCSASSLNLKLPFFSSFIHFSHALHSVRLLRESLKVLLIETWENRKKEKLKYSTSTQRTESKRKVEKFSLAVQFLKAGLR